MSAWGSGGSARSCNSILERVERNDASLKEWVVLSLKTFGPVEVRRLATCLAKGNNSHLQSLSASGHELGPVVLEEFGKALSSGKSVLRRLAIGNNDMGDEGTAALCRGLSESPARSRLEYLDLSWKQIGSDGMQVLVNTLGTSESLTTLILPRNPALGSFDFSNVSANTLFPRLQHLDISDCGFSAVGCTDMVAALASISVDNIDSYGGLTLHASHNVSMGDIGFQALLQLPLIELKVANCGLEDDTVEYLVRAQNERLRVLDMSQNRIGPRGLSHLATGIVSSLPSLQTLSLAGNALSNSSECVSSFAHALNTRACKRDSYKQLADLDLTGTSCGVDGARNLIQFANLQRLTLFNNQLGSDGLVELSKVLRGGHPVLESLDVGGNQASEAGVVALLQALAVKSNSFENKLNLVVVGGNQSGPTVETVVKDIAKVHPGMDIARDKPKKNQHEQIPT